MYYPEEIVEEVRSKNDIVDIISGYVRLNKKGSSYFGLCPFHNEKTGSFSVSAPKQMYYCFGCGASGNVYTFLMKYENDTFQEAIQKLADRAGVKLPEVELTTEQKKQMSEKAQLLEINKVAANYFYMLLRHERGKKGLDYIRKRELTDETMKTFALGYSDMYSDDLVKYLRSKGYSDEMIIKAGLASRDEVRGTHDKFWNRVMFPIQDMNHRVIGFGGRVMGEGEPKYLNSPETPVFDKSRNLYGLNFARSSKKDYLILVEGYMDVISMHQAGFIEAVASLGTAFTSGQAQIIKRFAKTVYLSFDSDDAGTRAKLRAIGILKEAGIPAKVIDLSPYKDPDEFIKNLGIEEMQKRIDEAVNSFYFEIKVIEKDFNLNEPDEKTQFCRKIAEKLCEFSDELERNNYLEAICVKYGISTEGMKDMVIKYASMTGMAKPVERPKQSYGNRPKEDGNLKAQKLLITWICEQPSLLSKIEKYISQDDFTEELYRNVAGKLFDGIRRGGFEPVSLVSLFEDEEEQKEVATLFNTKLTGLDGQPLDISRENDLEKAFHDILLKVKTNSLNYYSMNLATDVLAIEKVVQGKKQLEELKKEIIHLK